MDENSPRQMKRIANALCTRRWGKRAYTFFVLCATTPIAIPAQTLATLHSFDYTDGDKPQAGLVQGADGNLYGTTTLGGAHTNGVALSGQGTVFKITPSGTLTTLYSFCSQNGCTDGANPSAALVQGTDGNLYGTTQGGGANVNDCGFGCGTVFKITASGTLTTL